MNLSFMEKKIAERGRFRNLEKTIESELMDSVTQYHHIDI